VTFPWERFLNQTCDYQQFSGVDDRDDPTYLASVQLACRYVDAETEKYAKTEDAHNVTASVMLAVTPVLRSLVNGREVVSVKAAVTVGGAQPGWVAVLR